MHFSPFISADIGSGGSSPGKPAIKTGPDGLFAAHLATAAREQTSVLQRAETKSTQESLISLITALYSEGSGRHEGIPVTMLFDHPASAETVAPSSLEWQGVATPDAFFSDDSNPAVGGHLTHPEIVAPSSLEWQGIATPAAFSTDDSKPAVEGPLSSRRSAAEILAAAEGTRGIAQVLQAGTSGTSKDAQVLQAEISGTSKDNLSLRGSSTETEQQPSLLNRQTTLATLAETANTKGLPPASGEKTVEAALRSPLTREPMGTDAERAVRTAGPGGGTPLAIFDNTGAEHRPSKVADTGTGVRFNEASAGETATRNSAGQTITIRQFGQTEETLPPPATGSRPVIETNTSPQDTKAHYIYSNLPNKALRATGDTESGQQQENRSNQQKDPDSSRLVQQVQTDIRSSPPTLAMTGQDSEALQFSHSPMTTPQVATVAQTEPTMFRLPSGLLVPHSTVIDQVIAHFSANSRLESGSVSLQLHPRELGALRLEIKVEQDNIKAHITVQNPQAQEMIDRHLPRLREALQQQGLQLQQVEVTIAAEDNTNGHRFQGNSQQEQATGRSQRNRLTPAISASEIDEPNDFAPRTTGSLSVHA